MAGVLERLRRLVAGTVRRGGARAVVRLLPALRDAGLLPRDVVLCYHRVVATAAEAAAAPDPELVITRDDLRRQLDVLAGEYALVPLAALDGRSRSPGSPAPASASRDRPRAALTFDDGDAGVLAHAVPVLAEHGVPGTVFVAGAPVVDPAEPLWFDLVGALAARFGDDPRWPAIGGGLPVEPRRAVAALVAMPAWKRERLLAGLRDVWRERRGAVGGSGAPPRGPYLDVEGLREVVTAGWEVGGHTVSHPVLPGTAAALVRREVEENRAALAAVLGMAPTAFAYPGGFFDEVSLAAVRRAGYEVAYTVDGAARGFEGTGAPLALDRKAISGRTSTGPDGRFFPALFLARASGAFDAIRRLTRAF